MKESVNELKAARVESVVIPIFPESTDDIADMLERHAVEDWADLSCNQCLERGEADPIMRPVRAELRFDAVRLDKRRELAPSFTYKVVLGNVVAAHCSCDEEQETNVHLSKIDRSRVTQAVSVSIAVDKLALVPKSLVVRSDRLEPYPLDAIRSGLSSITPIS